MLAYSGSFSDKLADFRPILADFEQLRGDFGLFLATSANFGRFRAFLSLSVIFGATSTNFGADESAWFGVGSVSD